MTSLMLSLVLACSTSRAGTSRLYAQPVTPICVKELFENKFSPIPATIIKGKSLGFFDFRSCDAASIGMAWVKEKRLRIKYEKQIGILNEK